MLTIRSLNGATDCGTRDPSLAGGNSSTRSATRVARVRRASEFSHCRLAIEPALLAQLDGLARQFRLRSQPDAIAVVGRHKAMLPPARAQSGTLDSPASAS